jgi:small-conductance mechanosensitive channel/CRP-like cAMP-binding protein
VSFWSRLLAEGSEDLSFVLVAALIGTIILIRTLAAPDERGRIRAVTILTILHLVLLLPAASLRADPAGAWYRDARLAALVFLVLAFVGMAASVLFSVLLPRVRVHAPRILRDVLGAVTAIVATLAVADRLGFSLTGVLTTSAILTAVIGFALQDTLGNVLGGLALQLDNSIAVGDWVKIGDLRGRVAEIRWRYTAIETRNWETVVIPNSMLMKGQVVVEGRHGSGPEQLRRWVWFNVDFRFEPTEVIGAVNEALVAASIDRVAVEPAAQCILMDLHESYGRYAVRYWLTDLQVDDGTDSVIRTRIYFALKRAGIPLSMPAHAVFLTEENVERKHEKTEKDRERRHAALVHVDLFDALDGESRDRLADGLRYAPFARGEAMTRQGAEGHWLYMIVDGQASVRVAQDGVEKEIARLGPGNFFGEMSLMTGARRTATVVATTDVDCYCLDKAAFQQILQARPELADGLASILAQRRAGLAAAKEGLDAEARERRLAEDKRDILYKMRAFFGLAPEKRAAS